MKEPAEDPRAQAERRRALRALLNRPMLHDTGLHDDEVAREDLRLIRRHREVLTRDVAQGLGYRLIVEGAGARLVKAGLGRDGTRPLRRPTASARAFGPRGYALLALALAALTRGPTQLLLDELVAAVRSVAADAGVDVDLDRIADRRALHAALLVLIDLGVLVERDGNLDQWAEKADAQSLLDVSRDRLRLVLAVPLSGASTPDDLLDAPDLPSAAGGARIAVRRRLAESPVMSVAELDDEQAAWWGKNRHREAEWFADRLGLEIELRAEGALAIDPAEELTDLDFPGAGSGSRYALLLLGELVAAVRDLAREAPAGQRTWWPIDDDTLDRAHARVLADYGHGFSKDHRNDPQAMRSQGLELLAGVGLLRTDPHLSGARWRLHAAAARYAPLPVEPGVAAGAVASLFDAPQADELQADELQADEPLFAATLFGEE